jgi:hypothetical protein
LRTAVPHKEEAERGQEHLLAPQVGGGNQDDVGLGHELDYFQNLSNAMSRRLQMVIDQKGEMTKYLLVKHVNLY